MSTNLVHTLAFYAGRQQGLMASFRKSAATYLSLPLFAVTDQYSRKVFNDLYFKRYKGQSEDRLRYFAQELFEDVIQPNIYPRARELIDESRRAGVRQVLVSGALDFTMRPLARYLGVDDLIANQLEFVDHYATGKLKKPFVAGATKADIMRAFAKQHDVDLGESWAYSDSFSDYAMLAAVGHPTACNPDMRLLATARSYDWPVLYLDEEPSRSAARRPQGLARQIRRGN